MTSICIDAMGGDFGPQPIIGGVIEALKEVKFEAVLVGDTKILESLVPQNLKQYVKFIQADEVVSMSDGATDALKRKERPCLAARRARRWAASACKTERRAAARTPGECACRPRHRQWGARPAPRSLR